MNQVAKFYYEVCFVYRKIVNHGIVLAQFLCQSHVFVSIFEIIILHKS